MQNNLNYTEEYGIKSAVGNLNVVKCGQGFTSAMFPDTAGEARIRSHYFFL